jgi:hypothetical protein
MLNGGPQAGACAQGVPEQVDPIELELVDECGDVIAGRLCTTTSGVPPSPRLSQYICTPLARA